MDANELIEHLDIKFTKTPKDIYVSMDAKSNKYGIDLDGLPYKTISVSGW